MTQFSSRQGMIVCSLSKYKPIMWAYYTIAIKLSSTAAELRSLHIQKPLKHLTNLMICSSRNGHHSVHHSHTNYINGLFYSIIDVLEEML